MPIVLRIGPYRIGFYSSDQTEPPHVHVRRERKLVKFWLNPEVVLERNVGFAAHELNTIQKLIAENREFLL